MSSIPRYVSDSRRNVLPCDLTVRVQDEFQIVEENSNFRVDIG